MHRRSGALWTGLGRASTKHRPEKTALLKAVERDLSLVHYESGPLAKTSGGEELNEPRAAAKMFAARLSANGPDSSKSASGQPGANWIRKHRLPGPQGPVPRLQIYQSDRRFQLLLALLADYDCPYSAGPWDRPKKLGHHSLPTLSPANLTSVWLV